MCLSDETKCLLSVAISNGDRDCPKMEDESIMNIFDFSGQLPFSTTCNSHLDFIYLIHGAVETDETNCSFNEFQCINKHSNVIYCLSSSHMFHKRIDNCTENEFIQELYFKNDTNNINENYYSFNSSKCISDDNIWEHHSTTARVQEEVCLHDQIL
jgi:hypothetical protein